MAVPERVNLFRVQALRGVGGNGWRMSHNPYRDSLYDTMDRLGVLVWDETRDLKAPMLPAFGQMVREHRNHPSIMVWSFCNEGGCGAGANHTLAEEYRSVAYDYDGTRRISGNMRGTYGTGTLSDVIDVQGLSHPSPGVMDGVHKNVTGKALIASECCSCMTMRGENHKNSSIVRPVPSQFNADCLADQVNRSDDGRPWSVGSMIWTLFDYFGELLFLSSFIPFRDCCFNYVCICLFYFAFTLLSYIRLNNLFGAKYIYFASPPLTQVSRTDMLGLTLPPATAALTLPAFLKLRYGGA